jgi:hypothetical protein
MSYLNNKLAELHASGNFEIGTTGDGAYHFPFSRQHMFSDSAIALRMADDLIAKGWQPGWSADRAEITLTTLGWPVVEFQHGPMLRVFFARQVEPAINHAGHIYAQTARVPT